LNILAILVFGPKRGEVAKQTLEDAHGTVWGSGAKTKIKRGFGGGDLTATFPRLLILTLAVDNRNDIKLM